MQPHYAGEYFPPPASAGDVGLPQTLCGVFAQIIASSSDGSVSFGRIFERVVHGNHRRCNPCRRGEKSNLVQRKNLLRFDGSRRQKEKSPVYYSLRTTASLPSKTITNHI